MAQAVLTWLLRGGAAYFVGVAVAHWMNWKVPVLFLYYNIPSTGYQDKGIGTLSFGWAVFMYAASRHRVLMPAVLVAGVAGLIGFALITGSPEIVQLAGAQGVKAYWVELLMLAGYLGAVAVIWRRAKS